AENHTIQIALVGCGGRGTGGLQDALRSTGGPLKVVALADVFQHKVENTLAMLKKRQGDLNRMVFGREHFGGRAGCWVGAGSGGSGRDGSSDGSRRGGGLDESTACWGFAFR
ncbi:MAG: hypothetical protein AAFP69_17290, partial [Planctomycetota bacterium]